MTSDTTLRRWLLRYNEIHFGGELPIDHVHVWWEPCGPDSATTTFDGEDYHIRIDPAAAAIPRHAKIDLNHELAHVKLWPVRGLADHGKRFDEEIARLCQFKTYRKLL